MREKLATFVCLLLLVLGCGSDVNLALPTPSNLLGHGACEWHHGLVDTHCGATSSTITSHDPTHGIVVCTGDLSDYDAHACNGRRVQSAGIDESAGIEMWVR